MIKILNIGTRPFFKGILGFILATSLWAAIALIITWPVQLLWNWLMPAIFSLPAITFWQALGLQILIALLFKLSVSTSSS